ncbi:MAG: glutathione-independent formaldehyde dehydrogenase [Candidatus Omnitrophota bacterium]
MKAVVYEGKKDVDVKMVEKPTIQDSRDAILKITSAAICGSDLHMYDGRTTVEEGKIFGHEMMGIIEEVGNAIKELKPGDRVVLPFNIACGMCENCIRGLTNACLFTNPKQPGAAYGYAGMGPYNGGQAQYVRVPFADFNALKLPGKPYDEFEEDFLLLSDIFPTGYHACVLAHVRPGSSVAIYGAGPVGLLAAHSAFIKGAAQVFVIDESDVRLNVAKKFGAIPINYRNGKPSEQIKNIRNTNPLLLGSLRPGEEKNLGVMCAIDAVGYQAKGFTSEKEDPTAIINDMVEIVNYGGHLGIIGVFVSQDPGAADPDNKQGIYKIPYGRIWEKGLSIGTGQTPVRRYDRFLRDLIIAGRAKPSLIVSQHTKIDSAPEDYRLFDFRGIGEGRDYTKVVLKPNINNNNN